MEAVVEKSSDWEADRKSGQEEKQVKQGKEKGKEK